MTRYLDVEAMLVLVRRLHVGHVRDVGLLDAAAARPQATAFGVEAYPTLALKAAALLHSVTGNHALVDGNKRLGWLATLVFLDLNDAMPRVTEDEAFTLVMDVAAGRLDLSEIASRLRVSPVRVR